MSSLHRRLEIPEEEIETKFGSQLVGCIPCSDAFNLDSIKSMYDKMRVEKERRGTTSLPLSR